MPQSDPRDDAFPGCCPQSLLPAIVAAALPSLPLLGPAELAPSQPACAAASLRKRRRRRTYRATSRAAAAPATAAVTAAGTATWRTGTACRHQVKSSQVKSRQVKSSQVTISKATWRRCTACRRVTGARGADGTWFFGEHAKGRAATIPQLRCRPAVGCRTSCTEVQPRGDWPKAAARAACQSLSRACAAEQDAAAAGSVVVATHGCWRAK